MKIREVQDRTVPLVTALLAVWEKSVRATHTFLSEEEIEHIKTYVPTAFHSVQHLLTAETASGEPVAFMGITGDRLEMLFLLPEVRGQGLGRQLLEYAIRNYGRRGSDRQRTKSPGSGVLSAPGLCHLPKDFPRRRGQSLSAVVSKIAPGMIGKVIVDIAHYVLTFLEI